MNNTFQTSNLFENLAAGNYTFVVRDVNGMEAMVNLNINEPAALSLQIDTDQDQALLNAQGGTVPYQYSVDNSALQSSPQFSNLTAGSHTATVVDANECTLSVDFTITISPIQAQVVEIANILCAGDTNGSIIVNASGGILPYTYSIDGNNFQDLNSFDNLAADVYTITVRDNSGLETEVMYTLTEPMALVLDAGVTNNMVLINVSGGTAPFEYNVNGGDFQTANQFFNLASGDYTFEVRDANDCTNTVEANVNFTALSGQSSLEQEISCAGAEDGIISTSAIGGTSPYTYSIDGITFQNAALFTNLGSGVYTVIIRDSDGIEFSTNSVVLNEPTEIIASLDQVDREVVINASGGTGVLGYSLDDITYQSDNFFDNLANGEYTVYIQDSRGCTLAIDFTIEVNDIIGILSISQNISCHDANDGIIAVEATGGTAPREYSIDGGATYQASNFFVNLEPGEYEVTIRDADGLTATTNNVVILTNPDRIELSVDLLGNDATILANGGTGNLQYSIDGINYMPDNLFSNLSNGQFTAYVRDANECVESLDFEVDFTVFSANTSVSGENLCAGDEGVSITVVGNGGAPPYTYRMGNGNFSNQDVFENLGAGVYDFSAQDATGSIINLTVEITEPSELTLNVEVTGADIRLIADGGTPPYVFSIDGVNFQDSEIFTDLENGQYTLQVRDANGCITGEEIVIQLIDPLSVDIEVTDILCAMQAAGGSLLATGIGGTAPYQYSLDNGSFQSSGLFENVTSGTHNLTIMDASMISVTTEVEVTAPSMLEADFDINDKDLEINILGGTPPYTYSLDGGQSFSDDNIFLNLEIGDYEVIVEDANGCTITQMISIISTSTASIDQSLIFSLYPNPAKGSTRLTLDTNTAQEVQISLVDILGRTVREYNKNVRNGDQYEIDINNILPGTYLIRVDIDGLTAIKKLIVQ